MNPILKNVTCPLCRENEKATLHYAKAATKNKKLYLRCYADVGGTSPICGTIQPTGYRGQEILKGLLGEESEPKGSEETEIEVDVSQENPKGSEVDEKHPKGSEEQEPPKPKGSWLDGIL